MEAVSNATQQVVDAAKQATTAAANLLVGKKKAVHFGGGNIGRGFVAEFLHKSGYEVVFVDVVDALIEKIQNTPSYTVTEIGTDDVKTFKIDNYRAINSKHNEPQVIHEIATADLVTCAVGPNILKFIAPVIAKGIDGREKETPLAVIACENMVGGTDTLAGFVKDKLQSTTEAQLPDKVRYANSAIDRIVPIQDPDAGLDVKIERFYEWCVDVSPFKGARGGYPPIQGVHFVEDLVPYIERKLYTVNTGHATAAYYGYQKGKTTIHEAMADEEIKDTVHKVLVETAHLIVNKHGIDRNEQKKYVESIVTRISNPHLEDLVTRVGRAPLRKIGRKERFIGPAAELAERGEPCEFLLGATEQLLKFQNVEGDEDSVELAKILKEKSAEEATEELTGLSKDHPLFPRVVERVKQVQTSGA